MVIDEFGFKLFAPVTELRKTLTGKALSIVLLKTVAQEDYWPRLTAEKIKLNYVKTDFGKWKDQDEQEEEAPAPEEEAPTGVSPLLLRRS